MSNLIFPALAGVSVEMSKTPIWNTTVHESVSGCSVALSSMTYPKYRYRLSFEVLRSGSEAELQQLVGFYNRHGGRADTWLFFDEEDCTVVDQQFGVGDGVTTDFYLVRDFGGFVEPVTDIKTLGSLTAGGVPMYSDLSSAPAESLSLDFLAGVYQVWVNDYAYAGGGRIQFSTAPAAGVPLVWSGEYYRRCRFTDDEMDLERFLYRLWKAKAIEFETHKGRA